jgi:hypothetical protein
MAAEIKIRKELVSIIDVTGTASTVKKWEMTKGHKRWGMEIGSSSIERGVESFGRGGTARTAGGPLTEESKELSGASSTTAETLEYSQMAATLEMSVNPTAVAVALNIE